MPPPEGTGGAGGTFEGRVGAIALAGLLRGDRLSGLGVAPTRVRLQQRVAGALLDDVVIGGLEPGGARRTIEYQIKHQFTPAPGNHEFVEIVAHVLTALGADGAGPDAGAIVDGRRRFGVAARPSTALADFARATEIARSHDTADSFRQVVLRALRAGVQQRHTQLRSTVNAVLTPPTDGVPATSPSDADLDEATWQVARAMHVWEVDAEPDGRDVVEAHSRLGDLVPEGRDAADVFRLLLDVAQSGAPQAASIDLGMLMSRLESEGVALDAAPPRRVAFDALRRATAGLLDPAAARLGHRLTLQRIGLREQARDALDPFLVTWRS